MSSKIVIKNCHQVTDVTLADEDTNSIPGPSGIPGLNSNPDPGILENIIPGFLGIYHIKQNHDFKDFYWFLNLIFPKKSRDKNVRLIPSRKIPGSHLVPVWNSSERWGLTMTQWVTTITSRASGDAKNMAHAGSFSHFV